jgi:hypothetical protein
MGTAVCLEVACGMLSNVCELPYLQMFGIQSHSFTSRRASQPFRWFVWWLCRYIERTGPITPRTFRTYRDNLFRHHLLLAISVTPLFAWISRCSHWGSIIDITRLRHRRRALDSAPRRIGLTSAVSFGFTLDPRGNPAPYLRLRVFPLASP